MHILSFDQGTTGSRAIIFDEGFKAVVSLHKPHRQIFERSGWVSHNACEIFENIVELGQSAIAEVGLKSSDISIVSVTNQRETVVAWDSRTGLPVCDAVVWQCRRTADLCERIVADDFCGVIRNKTGLLVDAYFSATKIQWILENVPQASELLDSGQLMVGTIDTYLVWRLTGEYVTDYTNASRTQLFNIHTLEWDEELCSYFKIPMDILPKVIPSDKCVGETKLFGGCIPVGGIAGDQHAALFGQYCFSEGDVKCTYGTGSFILKNIGSSPLIPQSKLLTTIGFSCNGTLNYALEGSVFNAGSAVEWLINGLNMVKDVDEINEICKNTPSSEGVHLVPAFSGLGAPKWNMYARGLICGMTLSTTKNHIVRSCMEAIAFQVKDCLECMKGESGITINSLKTDGGVSNSDFLMQFQSDILGLPVLRAQNTEVTSLGAALLGAFAIGRFKSFDELSEFNTHTAFEARMRDMNRELAYSGWKKAVKRTVL